MEARTVGITVRVPAVNPALVKIAQAGIGTLVGMAETGGDACGAIVVARVRTVGFAV